MKEVWSVSFEYRSSDHLVVPWEYWDHLTFATKKAAREFAQRMKARKMADRKVRQVHYRRHFAG